MPGVVVDGMDVFAVYDAAGEAVKRARNGEGPSLLELKTYRYHGHFHADVPENYRTKNEETSWKDRDPIETFRNRVIKLNQFTDQELEAIRKEIDSEMIEAVEFGPNSPMPDLDELYKDVYVNYSNSLLAPQKR